MHRLESDLRLLVLGDERGRPRARERVTVHVRAEGNLRVFHEKRPHLFARGLRAMPVEVTCWQISDVSRPELESLIVEMEDERPFEDVE